MSVFAQWADVCVDGSDYDTDRSHDENDVMQQSSVEDKPRHGLALQDAPKNTAVAPGSAIEPSGDKTRAGLAHHHATSGHELGPEDKPRQALALRAVVKPRPIAKASAMQPSSPPICAGGQDENFTPWAELAESAKKLLEECRALAPHERRTFGGAKGHKAKVKELEAFVLQAESMSVGL